MDYPKDTGPHLSTIQTIHTAENSAHGHFYARLGIYLDVRVRYTQIIMSGLCKQVIVDLQHSKILKICTVISGL